MTTIGIIGAGAWGTALALSFARNGHDIRLWARDPGLAESINATRLNQKYLPGIPLPAKIQATGDLAAVCAADILVPVIPAQYMRETMTAAAPSIGTDKPLVICAKGIEIESGKLMADVVADVLPTALISVLSGPNFAHEVAMGLPAAATFASIYKTKTVPVRDALASRSFRLYVTNDIVGTQVGGAVKNVIAIICGIVAGKGLGENARAAVVTRGLHEMAQLAEALGGQRETLMGLSGMGDLILTCSSMQSRNFSLGFKMGQGHALAKILDERHGITEGIPTARALIGVADRHKVEMPLVRAVHECLESRMTIEAAIQHLLDRPLTRED